MSAQAASSVSEDNAIFDRRDMFREVDDPLDGFKVLCDYYKSFAPLLDAEVDLLRQLATSASYHPPHRNLWGAGATPPPPRMLFTGWACRYRSLPNGRRQIICFILPGDLICPTLEPRLPSACAVAALTEVETISAKPLIDAVTGLNTAYPTLTRVAQLALYIQDTLLTEQIARLGQQTARERFAHLMLELRHRLEQRGLTNGNHFHVPLTQDVLGDALGLSVVHLNRMIQQLRLDGFLKVKKGRITLLQPDRLKHLAGWSPPPLSL